ncbi:MAG: rhomboid family intramembrane serine protease [Fimbriimonadaceae bacterium]
MGGQVRKRTGDFPTVTATIIALNVIIFFWGRFPALLGPDIRFAELAVRPSNVWLAITGQGDLVALTTLYSSLFLHAGLLHLLMNLLVFAIFGPAVERVLGHLLFCLFYLFWGVSAQMVQVLANVDSMIPVLGASGAVAGVLGAYFVLYPAKLFDLKWIKIPAALLIGAWLAAQFFLPSLLGGTPAVATWAHVGGFLLGMVIVLLIDRSGGFRTKARDLQVKAVEA